MCKSAECRDCELRTSYISMLGPCNSEDMPGAMLSEVVSTARIPMSCSHNKHKQISQPCTVTKYGGQQPLERHDASPVSDTKLWPHLPGTPCIFRSYRPRRRAKHCLPHSAHPEQPVLKRPQQTRRAKHCLHLVCTSGTASGQEALSRMLSPCWLLDLIEQVPLVLLARIPAGHQWLPAEPSFCFQLSESRTAPGTVAQPPVGTCQAAPDPRLTCSWRWQPA